MYLKRLAQRVPLWQLAMERRRAIATSVIVLAALTAGCTAGSVGSQDGSGTTPSLTVAQTSDVFTLDPSKNSSPISLNVYKSIFDSLTRIKADGSLGKRLAVSWDSNEDATVWTFKIRNGVRFHDGSRLTIEDIIWTYKKIRSDETSPVQHYVQGVKSIERIGKQKVRFILRQPFAAFARQTSLISILPKDTYQAMGQQKFAQRPVGSGPYQLKEWIKGSRLVLRAYDKYWKGEPSIETVIFRPVPNKATRLAGLKSGELDIVPLLPPSQVPALKQTAKTAPFRVATVPSNRVVYLGINVQNPKLDSLMLRKAMDYAINRKAITAQLLNGLGKPMGQIVAPVTFGYDPSLQPTPYDPAKAKKLVRKSHYDGSEIVIQYPNNRYASGVEVVQSVARYWRAIGLNVELEGMQYSAFFPLWTSEKLSEVHLFAYGPSIMDAELPLGSLFEAGSHRYWESARVDQLVKKQRAIGDPEERAEVIHKIWELNDRFLAYIPLYQEIQAYGISDTVKWEPRPDERLLMQYASYKGE